MEGPVSRPGRVIVLCTWARHVTLTVPLCTQEYEWVTANCQGNLMKCWEVTCDGLVSYPGGAAIFLVASRYPFLLTIGGNSLCSIGPHQSSLCHVSQTVK